MLSLCIVVQQHDKVYYIVILGQDTATRVVKISQKIFVDMRKGESFDSISRNCSTMK